VFLKAAEMLSFQPSDSLVVEDAHAGVEAAIKGGFDAAALGDAWNDSRAKWHLDSFSQLLEVVI